MMKRKIHKLSGIYQIRSKNDNKIYIGYSQNITLRWYSHIDNLMRNNHPNHKLQQDFNELGLANFEFSILELISNKKELLHKEQEYINKINLEENYNLINGTLNYKEPNYIEFIKYIEDNWLVKDKMTKEQLYNIQIRTKEQRNEILQKANECRLIPNKFPSTTTFNTVAKYMEDNLGYTIKTSRSRKHGEQYRYKLIEKYIDCNKNNLN